MMSAREFRKSLIPSPNVASTSADGAAGRIELGNASPASSDAPTKSAARPPPPPNPELLARRKALVERAQSLGARDHYALLGVDRRATTSEIVAAFFGGAKLFHPDKLPPELSDLRAHANAIFARLADAHRVLIDPARRAAYDAELAGVGGASERDEVSRLLEASAQFEKSEIFARRGDFERALPFAVRAVELDPDRAEHLALLGWVRAHLPPGGPQQSVALELLDRAIALDPSADSAHYFRGVVLKRVGRGLDAQRDFKRASELNPKNIDAMREVRLHAMRAAAAAKAAPKSKR